MSVLTVLQAGEGVDLFYWLRISGIPHYFFCGVNPEDVARYGNAAWAELAGDPLMTSVPGMSIPAGTLRQSMPDIVGGIASAESIRITLNDFEIQGATGTYPFLSRLMSPGIATSAGSHFELASDVAATDGSTDPISFRSGTVTPATGFYTIGHETIFCDSFAAPVNGISAGLISGARNRFKCSTVYPPTPAHRIVHNESGGPAKGKNILVTPYDTPFTMLGRTAALYIGAMAPNGGGPLPETDGLLRLLGRIKSISYGEAGASGAQYSIEIESIVDDLTGALAAPGLAVARIKDDQISLPRFAGITDPTAQFWLHFRVVVGSRDGKHYATFDINVDDTGITDNIFTLDQVLQRINDALAPAMSGQVNAMMVGTRGVGADKHVMFVVQNPDGLTYGLGGGEVSLLSALGFELTADTNAGGAGQLGVDGTVKFEPFIVGSGTGNGYVAIASKPAPSVFFPTCNAVIPSTSKIAVQGFDGSPSLNFFSDQGNGAGYVQTDDGIVCELNSTAVDASGLSLTIGNSVRSPTSRLPGRPRETLRPRYFYYAAVGTKPTIKQVVIAGDRAADVDPGIFVGRFLASFDPSQAVDDFNYYPEGVGLGWDQVIDQEAFASIAALGANYPREAVVDSSTKLSDLLVPILKEYGLALVWDPETTLITVRPLRTPSAPSAHAIVLSESNRTSVNDRTGQTVDQSNVRTSWTLLWGWDADQKKFLAPEITLTDNIVLSTGVAEKNEKIEDKTLVISSALDGLEFMNELMFSRNYLTRYQWMKCHRTLNRSGVTLAPGSYHQVVDATMINPFTGRPGVTAADEVYCLSTGVETRIEATVDRWDLSCEIDSLVNKQNASSFFRKWSPSGLVDFTAPGLGYDAGTGVLTMAKRYTKHTTFNDGYDFLVGDVVTLISWDSNSGSLGYAQTGAVVSAVAADGSTVTVNAGLLGIPADTEVLLLLEEYALSTAVRQATVAYQGSESALIIGGVAGARNHLWG